MTKPNDNLLSPAAVRDPQGFFKRLREHDPVFWSERHKVWILTDYDDVLGAFQDRSASAGKMISGFRQRMTTEHGDLVKHAMGLLDGWMLLNDPPAHTRLRDPVRKSFSPSAAEQLAPRVAVHVQTLLDRIDERCELIADFARPLTAMVICDLLGIETDQKDFLSQWSKDFGKLIYGSSTRDSNYIHQAAKMGEQFYLRFQAQIEARRTNPSDDLLSRLIAASDEAQWTENELIGACSMLLFAGHDTTSALLASSVRALLQNPEQLALLNSDPSLMPSAVEELLRYDGPSKTNIRVATAPMTLGGHNIAAGDHLWLGVMAANHDPKVFAEPEQLDVERNPNPHITFGAGIHFCLGPSLARVEARVALACLLERYPHMSLTGQEYEWSNTVVDRSLLALPVELRSSV